MPRGEDNLDLFSHALFPYLLGNYFKKNRKEITAFVIGGIAPDFDVFLLWIQYLYPTFLLITHRGITHSLVFGFVTGILILYIASRQKIARIVQHYVAFEPVFSRRCVMYAFAGVLIHLGFDFSTTRGVPLLYPIVVTRYSAELFDYTDIFITIVSLIMVVSLFRKPFNKGMITKFLVLFLIVLGGLGTLRIVEKYNANQFFHDGKINSFPTMNPFTWYIQKEYDSSIQIFEYNSLENMSMYNDTFQRLTVLSGGEGFENALSAAEKLPQVKMFRWRAHSVIINASYNNLTWSFQYSDPVMLVEMRNIPTFRIIGARFGSLMVNVTGDKAIVS